MLITVGHNPQAMICLGTEQKAKLLEIGEIFIPKEVDMPCFASRSTAGPDAGSPAHAFQWGDSRVKLAVTKDPGARLRLAQNNEGFGIFLDEEKYIENVGIIPLVAHAPDQAFLNLSGECRMGCAFCAMPPPEKKESLSTERAMHIININSRHPNFGAVAITSGIPDSVGETNARMTDLVKAVRSEYPNIPIGVEAYFDDLDDINRFKKAGATEMKINIETWPRERFERICPGRDFDSTIAAIEEAVRIFGRGKVTGNILVGLGESDADIIAGVKALAGMGAVPNVRGIRIGPGNREKLESALGHVPEKVSAERLLELGKKHRNVLEMNGLTTGTFETMCFTCRCCDLVPMVDV
ncbi:MAG: radical SAM protein [Thermoplasmata archaeon]